MTSMNKAIIIGNLGRDPEIRNLQNGDPIANLSVATSENFKGKDGEWKEQTEWHRVTVFNKNATNHIQKYGKKGKKVMVEGKIQTRKWTDQSGTEKYTTEIVVSAYGGALKVLDPDKAGSSNTMEYGASSKKPITKPAQKDSFLDDEIPF